MKTLALLLLILSGQFGAAQTTQAQAKTQLVDAACGQCQFAMKGKKGCDLAVRINGKSYFVEGSKIDDHGDAHATDGMCSAIRKAKVSGTIVSEKFAATSFVLIPAEKNKSN